MGGVLHLKRLQEVQDTRVVHLDPAAQMLDLGHDVEIPVDVPGRTRCLCIPVIVGEELLALAQCSLVVADDFRERPSVAAEDISALSSMRTQRRLGPRDGTFEPHQAIAQAGHIVAECFIILAL